MALLNQFRYLVFVYISLFLISDLILSKPLDLPNRGFIKQNKSYSHNKFPFLFRFPVDTIYSHDTGLEFQSYRKQLFLLSVDRLETDLIEKPDNPTFHYFDLSEDRINRCENIENGVPLIRYVGIIEKQNQNFLLQLTCTSEF